MSGWILALHSSTPVLGAAVLHLDDPVGSRRVLVRPAGRELTNSLPVAVQELLPASHWNELVRLGVAIGPGGFTGTRLTVVMARTLAQQLGCPLDPVSSFALMATRLHAAGSLIDSVAPFWIVQDLPRRGQVAGLYQCQGDGSVTELERPHLLKDVQTAVPALPMVDDVEADVSRLLDLSLQAHRRGDPGPWEAVLPIYPTSPVGQV